MVVNCRVALANFSHKVKKIFFNRSSPLAYRLAKGAFWAIVGSVFSRAMLLAASIIIARVLGKEDYGQLGAIQSTVGMLGTFAGLGLGMTATKYVAEFRWKDPSRAGRIISLSFVMTIISGLLMTIILYVLAPWLAAKTLAAPHLSGLLRIGTLLLFFSAVNGAQVGALSGMEAFRSIAKINIFSGIVSFPIMIVCVYLEGLQGVIWGYIVSAIFNCIGNHIVMHNEMHHMKIPMHYGSCFLELPILWSFSLPAVLSSIMVGPVNWFCSVMLVNQPGGYAQLGIFNAANQWFTAMIFLPGIIGQVVVPILSEQLSNQDVNASKRILLYSILGNALCVLPVVVIGCAISNFIIGFYGPAYEGSELTFIVVLFTAALFSMQNPAGSMLIASGEIWVGFFMNLGWGIVVIILTHLLLNQGSFGFACAKMGAYAVHSLWTFSYVFRRLQKRGNL